MPLHFNTLLKQAGIEPSEVRLLRHQDGRADKGRTPYELWRDNRPAFETYQGSQSIGNRPKLRGAYWAAFVVTPANETLLAGFYRSSYVGVNDADMVWTHREGIDAPGTCDLYDLTPEDRLNDLEGCLVIEWGDAQRVWIQRADNQDKIVLEIRQKFLEPAFPGYNRFILNLSKIGGLPPAWASALAASKGVYLLTCPGTSEQYVGSATGSRGFLGRWLDYAKDGHGGNVGLKSRDPSDYQVSILEVAGSSATIEDIIGMEALWKQKLQSREMGLNEN